MGLFADLFGTMKSYFKIGGTSGVRLKNNSAALHVKNADDSAFASVTALQVDITGNTLTLNSDAAGSGADYDYTINRPASGMSAAVALTLPVDDGTAGQNLVTDGNGVLSWASSGSTAQCLTTDVTALAFGTSSPVSMFTLPANAVIDRISVIVDTIFNGTAPTLSIGVSGTTSKYVGTSDVDLKTAGRYDIHPVDIANGSTEALIITYAADSSSAGAARVLVHYSVPQ